MTAVVRDQAVHALRPAEQPDWASWLTERLDPHWRTGEWDPASLLFTADLDNPRTRAFACRVAACGAVVESPAARCAACPAVSLRRGHPSDFDATHVPSLPAMRQPNVGDTTQLGRTQFSLADLSPAVTGQVSEPALLLRQSLPRLGRQHPRTPRQPP